MNEKIKAGFNKELIHQIDKLVMNTGYFQPVEFLLELELLDYAEYEQWRMGHRLYLSELLDEKKEVILPLLDEAVHYVKSLKMLSEPLLIQQWEKDDPSSHLELCPYSSIFSDYLKRQYYRQDDEQMDLFFDNRSLIIINELKRALISRNIKIASQQFHSLYELEPEHQMIIPAKKLLDSLIDALEEDQVLDTNHEMQFLTEKLAPLAKQTLNGLERDYMSLFWRRLARYVDDSIYTEPVEKSSKIEKNNSHSSFCYEQIPDWHSVIKSIEQTPGLMQSPRLFTRYCLALRHTGQYERYMQKTCQFFWQFLDEEDCFFNEGEQIAQGFIMDDPILKSIWYDFHDLELDAQWGKGNFPCLILLKIPGICHYITANEKTTEEFRILLKLIKTEVGEGTQSITLRKQLKVLHADILQYYLKYNS